MVFSPGKVYFLPEQTQQLSDEGTESRIFKMYYVQRLEINEKLLDVLRNRKGAPQSRTKNNRN